MSAPALRAPALRAPAPWTAVVRAESAALWQPKPTLITLAVVVLLTLGPFGGGPWEGPLSEVRDLAVLMFFFPLLHWRGRAGRGPLDDALPVDTVRHDLVRIGCGAAGAAFTLALATGLNLLNLGGWYARMGGYPAWYPLAVIVAGLGFYLAGAALTLRTGRPGRMLLAAFVPTVLALHSAGVRLWTTGRTVTYAPDGRVTGEVFHTYLSLPGTLAWLAVSIAAVLLSAALGGHGAARRMQWRTRRPASPPLTRRVPVTPPALDVPRQPASAGVVAMRQLAVQAPRMAVPLLLAVLVGAWSFWRETRGGWTFLADGAPMLPLLYAAFFWPLLVWMDEHRGREWDQSHPADTFERRLLHAAGGLVWLLAAQWIVIAGSVAGALAEGTLQSVRQVPAALLPGISLAVLGLYCLGTAWAMVSAHPVRLTIIGFLVTMQGLTAIDILWGRSPLSPSRAFGAVNLLTSVRDYSMGATLFWIAVAAALAVAAIRHRMRRDLYHTGPASAPHVARPTPLRLGEVL